MKREALHGKTDVKDPELRKRLPRWCQVLLELDARAEKRKGDLGDPDKPK